jgi:hypothetical protein
MLTVLYRTDSHVDCVVQDRAEVLMFTVLYRGEVLMLTVLYRGEVLMLTVLYRTGERFSC